MKKTQKLPSRQMLVPRTSRKRPPPTSPGRPLKILFDHPGDILIWRPVNVQKWRPWNVLIWCPRDIPGRLIRDVLRTILGRPQENHQNTSLGQCGVICLMSLNFFLFFFWNLCDWPNLSKSNSVLKVYLEPSRTSKMEHFCEFSEWLLSVNYFR